MTPKRLLRIARFQRALALKRRHDQLSWSTIAVRAGYYDQAHMLHDSNDIVGSTPAVLLAGEAGLTESFLSE